MNITKEELNYIFKEIENILIKTEFFNDHFDSFKVSELQMKNQLEENPSFYLEAYIEKLIYLIDLKSNEYSHEVIGNIHKYVTTKNEFPINGLDLILTEEERFRYETDEIDLVKLPNYKFITNNLKELLRNLQND